MAGGRLIKVHFNCKTIRAREKRSSTAGGRLIRGSYKAGTIVLVIATAMPSRGAAYQLSQPVKKIGSKNMGMNYGLSHKIDCTYKLQTYKFDVLWSQDGVSCCFINEKSVI